MDDRKPDRFGVDNGARKLAIDIAIRALIEHAGATDSDFRRRILAAVETYLAALDPQSELENDFAERAKAHVGSLIRPPIEVNDPGRQRPTRNGISEM
ncbi:hypothetical protein OSJ77_19950 [Phyllobacterium sp. 0TCS1.6C]|uniref:hypothetical protein n=1 Tax=unclassified Phyllobacterium TaxID=2638441 RepID=UPI0022654302|nr:MULTISPECIES: hypothetical protein [unclassified Phyllobacterium]MCX8282468.1 hypothetical protein [Phyllobacterium sp. 0TCS1.6C]MCX8292560.1 hypothetical protein [Phyllobacterium sp. 0TCS1.6A]